MYIIELGAGIALGNRLDDRGFEGSSFVRGWDFFS
jgi:hypothetical protein